MQRVANVPRLDLLLNPIPSHIFTIFLVYVISTLLDLQQHSILDPLHEHFLKMTTTNNLLL